jgi:nitroreductase
MDVAEAIRSRASAPRLSAPGPSPEQLETILRAATRAPDHGRLSPWRFLVLEGDSRKRLGEAMAAVAREKDPAASAGKLESEAAKALRAPTIVVVSALVQAHPKVPEIEQLLAVGAAVQNMLLTCQALGIGAMWKTGAAAYSGSVNRALGLEPGEKIVAFLYLGTPTASPQPREDVAVLPVRRL